MKRVRRQRQASKQGRRRNGAAPYATDLAQRGDHLRMSLRFTGY